MEYRRRKSLINFYCYNTIKWPYESKHSPSWMWVFFWSLLSMRTRHTCHWRRCAACSKSCLIDTLTQVEIRLDKIGQIVTGGWYRLPRCPDRFAAVSLDATGGRDQTYPVNSAQSRNVTSNIYILSAGEENSSPTEAWKQSFRKRDYYRSAIRISPATAAAATTISTTTTVSEVNACPRCHGAPHLNLPPLTKSHMERERETQ